MTWISFLCFIILFLIIFSMRKGGDVFSPGKVFGFIWALGIGLADLKFSRLQHPWSSLEWIFLLLGVCSFLAGVYVTNVINLGKPVYPIYEMRKVISRTVTNETFLFRFTVILFLCYLASYSTSVMINGTVPLFSKIPSEARTRFGVFGIGLINHAAPAIMFLTVQYYLLTERHHYKKTLLAFIFIMTFLTYFLLLQRYDFALWAVLTLVFFYYGSRYVTIKKMMIVGLVVIGLFSWISSIRLTGHIAYFAYIVSDMKFPVQYAIFTEPYMYIVTNLENFTHAVSKLDHFTYGYYTFDFLTAISGVKHWLADYYYLNDTPYLTSGYNTYSFLWDFYRDFGIVGLAFFPFVEGIVISWLYQRMRQFPNTLYISMYGIAVFVMIISFFNHAPSLLHFVFNSTIVFIANFFMLRGKITRHVIATNSSIFPNKF